MERNVNYSIRNDKYNSIALILFRRVHLHVVFLKKMRKQGGEAFGIRSPLKLTSVDSVHIFTLLTMYTTQKYFATIRVVSVNMVVKIAIALA